MATVQFCEIDPYCQKVLKKHWPDIPIHDDIRTLDGEQFRGSVDVICGGWPCQTYSSAAHGNNVHPDMWPEFSRIIDECAPRWVIAENVSRTTDIRPSLKDRGYKTRRWNISCLFRGHTRDRVYFVADSNRDSESLRAVDEKMAELFEDAGFHWEAEPRVVGMDDGLSHRMDRLRALGNAVVPQIPEIIGRAILATMNTADSAQPEKHTRSTEMGINQKATTVGLSGGQISTGKARTSGNLLRNR